MPTRSVDFFFFQAEDGIRDLTVTGVQTCALPIFSPTTRCKTSISYGLPSDVRAFTTPTRTLIAFGYSTLPLTTRARRAASSREPRKRSEERRVGKECRSRSSAYHAKKNRAYVSTS